MYVFTTCELSVLFIFLPVAANKVSGDLFWWHQSLIFFTVPIQSDDLFYARRLSGVSYFPFNRISVGAHGVFLVLLTARRWYAQLICANIRMVELSQ